MKAGKILEEATLGKKTSFGKSRAFLPIFLVSCLSFAVYAATLNHGLVWDDNGVLDHIKTVTGEGGFPALFTSQFATHVEEDYVSGYYRPVSMWSLYVDSFYVRFFPFQYHMTNILLHVLNTILVFLLMTALPFPSAAFMGSAIFAVHPVHVESVAFISGRTDLLATLFVLLSTIFFIRARKGEMPGKPMEKWLSLAAFLCACFSKEVAYVLPGVLLLFDALFPQETPDARKGWWRRNGFWVLGWITLLAFIGAIRFNIFGPGLGVIPLDGGAVPSAVPWFSMTYIFGILLMYGRLLILPWPLRVYYSPQELAVTGVTILAFLALVFLFVWTGKGGHRKITVLAGFWIVIFLFPVLMPDQRGGALLAERFLYLPSVGFSLLVGTLAGTWIWKRRIFAVGFGIIVSFLALGSVCQGKVWKNEIVLFREFTRVSPGSPRGYYNLGNALSDQGRHQEAINEFQKAVRIDPDHYQAFFNMGNSFRDLKRNREAASSYQDALRVKPNIKGAWLNLGLAYLDEGDLERSIQTYRDGIRLFPDSLRMNAGLVLSCLMKGDESAAVEHHLLLERRNPDLARLIGTIISRYPNGKGESGTP